MHPSLLTLALATTALAHTLPAKRQFPPPPPRSEEFTVTFTAPGVGGGSELLSVAAVMNGSAPQLVLAGQSDSRSGTGGVPATPAYLNGISPSAALVFDLTARYGEGFAYGAKVDDIGNDYGGAEPVLAYQNLQDAAWGEDDEGRLYHKLFTSSEGLFACQDTVNGEQRWVLKFGVYTQEGLAPAGCGSTTLRVDYGTSSTSAGGAEA